MGWKTSNLKHHRCAFCKRFITKQDCLEHDWKEPGHDFRPTFGFCTHNPWSYNCRAKCPSYETLKNTLSLLNLMKEYPYMGIG